MKTHGGSGTPEYGVWAKMLRRCNAPTAHNYKNYGGRGITVCERWHKFENFIQDMGPRPDAGYSIERINNNRGYYPGNCKWATSKEQGANKRTAIVITAFGRAQSLVDWSDETGLKPSTILARIRKLHLPPEKALTKRLYGARVPTFKTAQAVSA